MKQITVSQITHARLAKVNTHHGFHCDDSRTNQDGTVSFLVTERVFEGLEVLNPDPERAIILLLNNQENQNG